MKFWVTYPLIKHPYDPALVTSDALTRFAQAAEAAGFDAIGFTDHPAPSHRWLSSGGHDALDPLTALAFVAAVTERLLLIPNIVVLPYRNPFLLAKMIATIDALSGGRFILATATGYQKPEFRALGVDFDERNALFDESVAVLRGVWSTDNFAFEGTHFTAVGQTANPKPANVPIWVGGNSMLSRRRVARYGDGWNPFPASAALAQVTKTIPLESVEDLRRLLDELWRLVDEAERDRSTIDVTFGADAGGLPSSADFNADAHLTQLGELAKLGVTWNGVAIPGDSLDHALDVMAKYGEQVIKAC